MAFAPISSDLSYWQKQDRPLFENLLWNIPEQKTGQVTIIGGSSSGFNSVIRLSEFLSRNFPIRSVKVLLPDVLRGKLPPLPEVDFGISTPSGSFDKSFALTNAFQSSDFVILAGDFSKNSATAIALDDAIIRSTAAPKPVTPAELAAAPAPGPLLITRDSIDLLATSAEHFLSREQTFLVGSLAQIQKIFRAVYYPKMLMLSQPLLAVIETLHKFTLTYSATIITFHESQIIVASGGKITTTPLASTPYSPISLWSGQLAGRVAALNLFNPHHPLEASTAAIL